MNWRSHNYFNTGRYLVLGLLGIILLIEVYLSLSWNLQFDTSFMHYVAYLINEHNFVPYRDLFEINMPGSYLAHMAVGKFFGYSNFAFRLVDISWLSVILIVTWFIMKPTGRITALASCLLFGLIYLGAGPYMSFQRDFLAILPIATAVLIATQRRIWNSINVTNFLLGVLLTLAALIKPHLVIGLPLLVTYNCRESYSHLESETKFIIVLIKGSLFALLGSLLTLAIPFIWLLQIGAIPSFWELFSSFVPLYSQMNRHHEFSEPLARLKQVLGSYLNFGGFRILFLSSVFGVYHICSKPVSVTTKKLAKLLFLLAFIYSIYTAIGGRFLPYHWIPYIYFSCLCTSLLLFSPDSNVNLLKSKIFYSLFAFIFTVTVIVRPPEAIIQQLRYGQTLPSKNGRVEEIAAYLNKNLSSNDRVQPLDWDGGALQAMLISKAILATSYICDFQFYHHVSTPYIQSLREDFLRDLKQVMPKFIIDMHAKSRVTGIDTSYDFPELETFIQKYYSKDYVGDGFDIFKVSTTITKNVNSLQ